MSDESAGRYRSPIIGDLNVPEKSDEAFGQDHNPHERVPMIVELNVLYPGGLGAVRDAFYDLWSRVADQAGGWHPPQYPRSTTEPDVPRGLALVAPKLYQCVISRQTLRDMVDLDQEPSCERRCHHDLQGVAGLSA